MILISSIFEDVALDNVNASENGNLSYAMFNRLSRRAELRLLDFISGDINNEKGPMPYIGSKVRDFLSPLIEKYPVSVENGQITKPELYYGFENMYILGDYSNTIECDTEDVDLTASCNMPIELLSNDEFYYRCNTYIEGLQPSFTKPIAKEIGNYFEFLPKDIGSIVLEFIKYPVFGKIITKLDTQYNQEVVDELLSTNYSWDEKARELLVFWITQEFSIHTREKSLVENNLLYGKLERDAR